MRQPVLAKATIKCAECGTAFEVHPYRATSAKFCSPRCRALYNGRRRGRRQARICQECGRTFSAPNNRVSRGMAVYCSNACKFAAARDRIERTCAQCGAVFEVPRNRLKDGRGRFCSKRCYYLYSGMGPSGPEIILGEALSAAAIPFKREVPIVGFRVDFLIRGVLAVEVDGSFWHALSGAREKDERKERAIAKRGWRLLRMDSESVRTNVTAAISRIKEALNATA